jgi:hypothetical protein
MLGNSLKRTSYIVQARGMRCLSDPIFLKQAPIVHLAAVLGRLMKIAPGGLARFARTSPNDR